MSILFAEWKKKKKKINKNPNQFYFCSLHVRLAQPPLLPAQTASW